MNNAMLRFGCLSLAAEFAEDAEEAIDLAALFTLFVFDGIVDDAGEPDEADDEGVDAAPASNLFRSN